MADSLIRKRNRATRLDGTATAAGGGQVRIPLKKEALVSEHRVRVQVSQAFAGVVPTSCRPGMFIKDIAIETSDGQRMFLAGYQAYDLGRFTENTPAPIVTLGATSTADFVFDIHHENDGALHDMFASIAANKLTTFDLVINFNADTASNNGFIGGTLPAAAAYTVTVRSKSNKGMQYDGSGQEFAYVESLRHMHDRKIQDGTVAGATVELGLISGNKTRFIMLHSFDTTVAGVQTPSPAVITDIRLVINGEEKVITTFLEERQENVGKRGMQVGSIGSGATLVDFGNGMCVLDWGDDEEDWLDLRGVNEPKLQLSIAAAGAPAAYRVAMAQDYSVVMK